MIPAPLDSLEARQRFVADVRSEYVAMDPGVDEKAACLYWSLAVLFTAGRWRLSSYGWNLQLQGGSASFIRLAPEDDDGMETTHNAFSYVFEDSPKTRLMIASDKMPEMHCWVACPEKGVMIDVTTVFLPDQCQETAGMPWTAKKPPPFVMFRADDPPEDMFYAPDMAGTALTHVFAKRWLDHRRSQQ